MILQKLKEETRAQHEGLETVVDVMNKMFTLEDYKTLLGKFYRFYAAVEPKLPIGELKEAGFDYEPRLKLPSLEADLKYLGVLEEVKATGDFEQCPDTSSVSKAFGSMYVIEGSTLGGQVITRHLKEHLDLTPEAGGAFFNSYGPMVGPMWKEFGAAITAYSEANSGEDETIVQSARDTFDSFNAAFTEQLTKVMDNANN
jgi:heme oxygenase